MICTVLNLQGCKRYHKIKWKFFNLYIFQLSHLKNQNSYHNSIIMAFCGNINPISSLYNSISIQPDKNLIKDHNNHIEGGRAFEIDNENTLFTQFEEFYKEPSIKSKAIMKSNMENTNEKNIKFYQNEQGLRGSIYECLDCILEENIKDDNNYDLFRNLIISYHQVVQPEPLVWFYQNLKLIRY